MNLIGFAKAAFAAKRLLDKVTQMCQRGAEPLEAVKQSQYHVNYATLKVRGVEQKTYTLDTVYTKFYLIHKNRHEIKTIAKNDFEFLAYRVATPLQRFSFKKAFSTRWRSLYNSLS